MDYGYDTGEEGMHGGRAESLRQRLCGRLGYWGSNPWGSANRVDSKEMNNWYRNRLRRSRVAWTKKALLWIVGLVSPRYVERQWREHVERVQEQLEGSRYA